MKLEITMEINDESKEVTYLDVLTNNCYRSIIIDDGEETTTIKQALQYLKEDLE